MESVLAVRKTPSVPRRVELKLGVIDSIVKTSAGHKRQPHPVLKASKKRENKWERLMREKPYRLEDWVGKFPGLGVPEEEQDKVIYGL